MEPVATLFEFATCVGAQVPATHVGKGLQLPLDAVPTEHEAVALPTSE